MAFRCAAGEAVQQWPGEPVEGPPLRPGDFEIVGVGLAFDSGEEQGFERRTDLCFLLGLQCGQEADPQQIQQEIVSRDQQDSTRADGPLICPDDAILLDTSDLTLEEVIDLVEQQVRQRAGASIESGSEA